MRNTDDVEHAIANLTSTEGEQPEDGQAAAANYSKRTGRRSVHARLRNRTGWASFEQECSRRDAQKTAGVGTTQ
jgi:hypothetical protein